MIDSKAIGKFSLKKKNLTGDVEDMMAVIRHLKSCHVKRN